MILATLHTAVPNVSGQSNGSTMLIVLTLLSVLGGGGGVIATVLAYLKSKRENDMAQAGVLSQRQIDLRTIDMEELRSLLPGLSEDIVKQWQTANQQAWADLSEARSEIDGLRDKGASDHARIVDLEGQLFTVRADLDRTAERLTRTEQRLADAKAEIRRLEQELKDG